MKTISFSSELLKPFLWCYFNKFLAGKIINNFCSSWTSCCNMTISFITKITFFVSTSISKMCTILTNFPAICVLFVILFLIRLLLNQYLLLLYFQILLWEFYQFHLLFLIIIHLFTQLLTTILLHDYHQATDTYVLIRLHCIILILCDVLMLNVVIFNCINDLALDYYYLLCIL